MHVSESHTSHHLITQSSVLRQRPSCSVLAISSSIRSLITNVTISRVESSYLCVVHVSYARRVCCVSYTRCAVTSAAAPLSRVLLVRIRFFPSQINILLSCAWSFLSQNTDAQRLLRSSRSICIARAQAHVHSSWTLLLLPSHLHTLSTRLHLLTRSPWPFRVPLLVPHVISPWLRVASSNLSCVRMGSRTAFPIRHRSLNHLKVCTADSCGCVWMYVCGACVWMEERETC